MSVGYQSSVSITRLQPSSSRGVTCRRSAGSEIARRICARATAFMPPSSQWWRVMPCAPNSWKAQTDARSSFCSAGKRSNARLARSE